MSDLRRATLEEAERKCRDIARRIKAEMPPGWGFTVILNSFGENGLMTYLSSCAREDMIKALREMADKLERREPYI